MARRDIAADGYPMSIGELTNIYRDGELIIRPEFQRIFRWKLKQKSRLIESILLGIPIPSIFVAQQEKGKWELVDGLQRISTILEFQGELRSQGGALLPQLVLNGTEFLPALEGCTWDKLAKADADAEELQLDFKRSKLDIKIIKRESSPAAKYDLFQRLNSYGSVATPQEIRSAALVAISPAYFSWVESLAALPSFKNVVCLSDRLIEERYDLELVIRFIVLHARPTNKITQSSLRDFPQFLNDESAAHALANPQGDLKTGEVFRKVFDTIENKGGADIFRKWDSTRREFTGSFLNTAYETFALGLGFHIAHDNAYKKDLLSLVRTFWEQSNMQSGFATGRSTEARLSEFVPLGRTLLAR